MWLMHSSGQVPGPRVVLSTWQTPDSTPACSPHGPHDLPSPLHSLLWTSLHIHRPWGRAISPSSPKSLSVWIPASVG